MKKSRVCVCVSLFLCVCVCLSYRTYNNALYYCRISSAHTTSPNKYARALNGGDCHHSIVTIVDENQ